MILIIDIKREEDKFVSTTYVRPEEGIWVNGVTASFITELETRWM